MEARSHGSKLLLLDLWDHEAYYAVLERAQRGTLNVTDWLGWFLEQVASACALDQPVAAKNRWLTRTT